MAKSNIYFNEVSAVVNVVGSIDLSNIYDITLANLDNTDTIKLAWDESTSTATEYGNLLKETSIDFVEKGKGGTLYYTANSGTATLRISGVRK
jgi:hypothetical protein